MALAPPHDRARVMWTGGGGTGGGPAMGLAFTSPEPSLNNAYKRWLAEVKQAATEEPAAADDAAPARDAAPDESKSASSAPPPAAPEPKGPVKRRLESPQGQAYDVLLEPHVLGWRLRIMQLPQSPGVPAPDHEGTYPDYASAEAAMRKF